MTYADWMDRPAPRPRCRHYNGTIHTHCAAGVAYAAVDWPLLGYGDSLPCFDGGLPCPARAWETAEEQRRRMEGGAR